MKIAVSTTGIGLDSTVESRFGRAAFFLVYDTETNDIEHIDNKQQLNAAQGAGIQSAQNVANCGADVLISSHCGPKAFKVLQTAGIAVYVTKERSVRDAILSYKENRLPRLTGADVEEHWV